MAKIKSWSGNEMSDYTLGGTELSSLASFCQGHNEVFIYGAGKIGKALKHYLTQSDLLFTGFVTSENIDDFKQLYCAGKTGIVIGVSDAILRDVMSLLSDLINESDIFILSAEYRERMGTQLSVEYVRENFWINVFVTNRCSLSCRSCSTFAPVTSLSKVDTDYDFLMFKRDIEQLSNMGLQIVNCIKFTGGEPLLHPRLFEMFATARLFFPQTPMECYTNGTLLNKLNIEQLELLKELGIILTITEYPLEKMDLQKFYEAADVYSINYNVIFSESQKMFSKRPLAFDKQTPKHCFFDCPRYTMCNSLFMYRGKLWKCIYSFNSEVFNDVFATELEIKDGDYLDLYHISPNDVYKFLISRIPFCGYCKPITELVPWGLSERKIEEWT